MEKFTIKVTDKGIDVISEKGNRMGFSAIEALMLLEFYNPTAENGSSVDSAPLQNNKEDHT